MAAGNVPGFKGALFKKALQTKLDRLHSTGAVTHAFWDRLVFRKVIILPISSIFVWKLKEVDTSSSWRSDPDGGKRFRTYQPSSHGFPEDCLFLRGC